MIKYDYVFCRSSVAPDLLRAIQCGSSDDVDTSVTEELTLQLAHMLDDFSYPPEVTPVVAISCKRIIDILMKLIEQINILPTRFCSSVALVDKRLPLFNFNSRP